MRVPVQALCRHDDAAWTATEVAGLQVQEVAHAGARLIVVRQHLAQRPSGGGKRLLEVPGYKFQALRTNLPSQCGCPGRMASLQRARRHREPHQGTRSPVRPQGPVLPLVLGHRGGVSSGHLRLQPVRRAAATSGHPATRRTPQPAPAPVWLRGGLQPSPKARPPSDSLSPENEHASGGSLCSNALPMLSPTAMQLADSPPDRRSLPSNRRSQLHESV